MLLGSIVTQFETIKTRLLTKPKTTEELMELIDYIDFARGELLPRLKEGITEGVKRHFALLNVCLLENEELEIASQVQTWHRLIQPVFEKSSIVSSIPFWYLLLLTEYENIKFTKYCCLSAHMQPESFLWEFFGNEPVTNHYFELS